MKIVIDKHIPFILEAVQDEWPEVDICPMKSDKIVNSAVRDTDVLVIRTRTLVNRQLLEGTNVRLVCTATIGFDHIDTDYCEAHHVRWMSCPGCNAKAVCDYIEEALSEITTRHLPVTTHHSSLTLGVVGVGHVGSLVAQMAERKGYNVLLNDPPKHIGVSLDEIARKCDIITFHVPLISNNNSPISHPTYHLCDEAFLAQCKQGALIINAARGGVVDETALLQCGHPYIIDTWENEPALNNEVLQHAVFASMHIAGYSVEGKRNASQMCLDAISDTFGLQKIDISKYRYGVLSDSHLPQKSSECWLAAVTESLKVNPAAFEQLRRDYPLRGE